MMLGSAADQVQKLLDIIGKDAKVGDEEGEGGAVAAVQTGPTQAELPAPHPKASCN